MKVRMTLMTDNGKPVSALGDNPEETVKRGRELVLALLNARSNDKVNLEKVEIVE